MNLTVFGSNIKVSKRYKTQTEKDSFVHIISCLELIDERDDASLALGIDLLDYNAIFIGIVENLIYLHYGEVKGDIIFWYLYERKGNNGEIFPFVINEIGYTISNAEELWELLNKIEE